MPSSATSRLSALVGHLSPTKQPQPFDHQHHIHQLSPTFFLPRSASIEPDALAVVHTTANGRSIRRTYQETADRACGLAYYIRSQGWKKVGILCPNTPAFLEAVFAIAAAGAVNVAVNYRLKPDDIAYIFDHANAEAILVDAEFEPLLQSYGAAHPRVPFLVDLDDADAASGTFPGPYEDAVRAGQRLDAAGGGQGWADLDEQVADEHATLALAYTSGTTARPKGVELTHRGVYLAALANLAEAQLNRAGGARFLWTLPLFHAAGWTFPWAVTAARGAHICLRRIDYAALWRLLRAERVTHFNAAPTVCTLLCAAPEAAPLPEEVTVMVAASPPSGTLFASMAALRLRPVHAYGLTETYGPVARLYPPPAWDALPAEERFARMARQGHGFLTSRPLRVVRRGLPAGRLEDVRRDGAEVGEVVCEGNICARGYYKDPEATRKLFEGGVLHTGDLAVWHPDGAVQIRDRAKDVIISGGENISSVAVESVLIQHPAILEAAVVAVADAQWGERPKAFVTARPSDGQQLRGEDVVAWAREQPGIGRFMVPREVEVVEELPKTSTGKVRKNVLREWAKGARRDDG